MIRIHLTEEQRRELHLLAHHGVGRVSKRAHLVLLSDQGKSPPEIASLSGYSAVSVREWLKRYQAGGIAGLYDRPRSGRPRKQG
jgi:transposase